MPRPPKSPLSPARKKPGPPKTVPDRLTRGPGGAPLGNQNAVGNRGGDGYPTKYDPDFHPRLGRKLALMQCTNVEIAEAFDVPLATLNHWLYVAKHVELVHAIVHSRLLEDAKLAYNLRRAGNGYKHKETKIFYDTKRGEVVKVRTTKHYPPDVGAAKVILYNSRGDKFKPHPENEDPNAGRGNVTLVIGGVPINTSVEKGNNVGNKVAEEEKDDEQREGSKDYTYYED